MAACKKKLMWLHCSANGIRKMVADTIVRARIDTETKDEAAKALAAMGLSVSDYIRMALIRVARDKAIPFPVKVPNSLTAETLRMSERGEDVHAAEGADDLFRKLGI
jgi:DNA-damage-inducible protein J